MQRKFRTSLTTDLITNRLKFNVNQLKEILEEHGLYRSDLERLKERGLDEINEETNENTRQFGND